MLQMQAAATGVSNTGATHTGLFISPQPSSASAVY